MEERKGLSLEAFKNAAPLLRQMLQEHADRKAAEKDDKRSAA